MQTWAHSLQTDLSRPNGGLEAAQRYGPRCGVAGGRVGRKVGGRQASLVGVISWQPLYHVSLMDESANRLLSNPKVMSSSPPRYNVHVIFLYCLYHCQHHPHSTSTFGVPPPLGLVPFVTIINYTVPLVDRGRNGPCLHTIYSNNQLDTHEFCTRGVFTHAHSFPVQISSNKAPWAISNTIRFLKYCMSSWSQSHLLHGVLK